MQSYQARLIKLEDNTYYSQDSPSYMAKHDQDEKKHMIYIDIYVENRMQLHLAC